MLVIRLLNSSNKFLFLLSFFMLFHSQAMGVESADIWKKETTKEKENTKEEKTEEKSKIDFSKENKNLDEIKIVDSDSNLENPVSLSGLYDPEKNDLTLTMWSSTDGAEIKKIFKRIEKVQLSSFSEKIFIDTIFTYSYPAKTNLSEEEFLKLKINWLIKNNKLDLIEKFLNTNLEFSGKSKLIKYLVDYYIMSANISGVCENFPNPCAKVVFSFPYPIFPPPPPLYPPPSPLLLLHTYIYIMILYILLYHIRLHVTHQTAI